MQTATKRILILGGGFGGVATAQELRRRFRRDKTVEITLVNRDNYFVFAPLLASAAAGSIEALHSVAPLRQLVPGVLFRSEEVVEVNLEERLVTTRSPATGQERQLTYDHLVIALGNVIDLSRLPGVAQHGKTIKTLGDALAIRNHVLGMLEAADLETDTATRREMLTFVVAGGGFSGVEMVGELNDLVRRVIKHYPSITDDEVQVVLLHGNDRLLPEMSASLADYGLKALRARGVEVQLKARLAEATRQEVRLEDGRKIRTHTLIVAVGNAPPPVVQRLEVEKLRGKIVVDEFMRVPGHNGVWALGDNAIVPNGTSPAPSPPTAQYALHQGARLGANIAAALRGSPPRAFAYGGLGLLCLIGHGAGIGELPLGVRVRGSLGWFLWRGVYWAKLPSFLRRFQVGFDWFLDLFLARDTAQINLARTQSVSRAHFEAGEYVFRQGETGDQFYLIQSGEVEVVRDHSSGDKVMLARLGRGEYFGETALLTGRRRNASVHCITPVDVIALGRDDFATLADTWAQLGANLREISDERAAAAPLTAFVDVGSRAGKDPSLSQFGHSSGRTGDQPAHLVRASTGEEIALNAALISLGRSQANEIVIADPMASRRHALIQREAGRYRIEDLGGQNGTWVNRRPLNEPTILNDGDVIVIGEAEFTFSQPRGPSVTALIQGLSPAAAPLPEPGPLTALIHNLDAPAPAASPPVSGLTGLIEDLNIPSRLTPPRVGEVTATIQGIPGEAERAAEARDDATGEVPTVEHEPQPETPEPALGSLTDAIQALDHTQAPVAAGADTPADRPAPRGSLTEAIHALDQPEHPMAEEAPGPIDRPRPTGPTPGQLTVASGVPVQPILRLALLAIRGPNNGALFEVGPQGATVGRALDNSIAILDEQLSRYHATVELRDGCYWLTDQHSFNGTLLNGTPLTETRQLSDGDIIELGLTHLQVAIS